jgi:hypothetical protein
MSHFFKPSVRRSAGGILEKNLEARKPGKIPEIRNCSKIEWGAFSRLGLSSIAPGFLTPDSLVPPFLGEEALR